VYASAQAAFLERVRFADLMAVDNRMGTHIDAATVARLLDPDAYTGLCSTNEC